MTAETKNNIQAVRKLYLSKALVPKEGHLMFFHKGQPITGWLDKSKGYPKNIVYVKINRFHALSSG